MNNIARPAALLLIIVTLSMFSSLAQDSDPPTIELLTDFPVVVYEGTEVTVEANIIDSSGVQSAVIAYELDGVEYLDFMVQEGPHYRYVWNYLNSDIGQRAQIILTILNITAVDIYSNPVVEIYHNTTITVLKEDVEGPEIDLEATPLYTEGDDHMIIRATVTDPSDVGWVRLYYEAGGQWREKTMLKNEETELFEAIIGPFNTDEAVRYYVNATDASPNMNRASTLDDGDGDMRSFVASFRKRFEGSVDDSNYIQVEELHRYRVTGRDTIFFQGYMFILELGDTGILTGNVSVQGDGWELLQDINLHEKSNAIIIDQVTKDGIVYDFNLKYLSYNPQERYAEIEINPRQKLVFEGYTIMTSIDKVPSGETTFIGRDGGSWRVSITVELGYDEVTRTFGSRNQFLEFFVGGRREIQIIYLGEEQVSGDLLRYRARLRVYKFQEPIFNVTNDVPTGSPSGLAEDQIIYNVYAGDELIQKVTAQNLAGSRAYDIDIAITNVTGHKLVIFPGELTSSLGPVYRERLVGNETLRYYLSYGSLTRSFTLNFPTNVQVRESAQFDVLLNYKDAHGDSHEIRIPVQFLIYPSESILTVTKRLTREEGLFIGLTATASIEVENIGGSPAHDVTVIDNTPPNLISDFETWTGEVKPGSTNKVSLRYDIKPTTITKPGMTSYGFVTVDWKGVCHKAGVRDDAHTLSTNDFYFMALGPHLRFTHFDTDRPIVDQDGQQMIFINVGEKVEVTVTVTNDGNKVAKNLSLDFPGFLVESTDFPSGTDVDVGQYFTFTTTVVAVEEGNFPFQAKITHYDQFPDLGNVYNAYSDYILAQTYLSPVVVEFIDSPDEISAGEIETVTLSIRNIGNSPVEDARVWLSLSSGLELVYGTYDVWQGRLGPIENILTSIQVKGKDFGSNRITAIASGRDIPDVEYELAIVVLSPHIEMVRTIDSEYLLAREEYWPRSSEIVSTVKLTLSNTGNDRAVGVVISEPLPEGLKSLDNLTFGSRLIIWGEGGDISLDPGESTELEYPIWSNRPGHYVYGKAWANYTNPRHKAYESESNIMNVWVLSQRPFVVGEGPVLLLDGSGSPLEEPASYNDTLVIRLTIRNIGNQNATGLDLGVWTSQGAKGIKCEVTNTQEVIDILGRGVPPGSILEVPIEILILEDVGNTTYYDLLLPLTYTDGEGRYYNNSFGFEVGVRPTGAGVSFTKSFWRSNIAPGESPKMLIQVKNIGDTALRNVQAVVDVPAGISIKESPKIDVLRESETKTINVEFDPVQLSEGQVFQTFEGFITKIEYESFRGGASTPEDGKVIEISVAKSFIDVERTITSTTLLARSEDWPFSSMIMENVTLTLTNDADVKAVGIKIVEAIPDGLYTMESLGTSQIVWGDDGSLELDKGQSIIFTYPVWSYEVGVSTFEPTLVTYDDPEGNNYVSLSEGISEVTTVMARPYLSWEGGIGQEPAGSLTYNDTVTFNLDVRNFGNSRSSSMSLLALTLDDTSDGLVLLNADELNQSLSGNLLAGSTVPINVRMRVLEDTTIPKELHLAFRLLYEDDVSREYFTEIDTYLFLRPAVTSVSSEIYDDHMVLMPRESGYLNLTITNGGDADILDVALLAETPEDVKVASASSLPVLGEGQAANLSIVFQGIDLGERVGRTYGGINLSVSYRDYKGESHVMSIATANLTIRRPMLTLRNFKSKPRTRLDKKYVISLTIANDGTFSARDVRVLLGDLSPWLAEMEVEGGSLDGDEIILGQNIQSLSEVEVSLTGRVREKGEFTVLPRVLYMDGIGNEYELNVDPVQVKSGEKFLKMILPFLIWAAVGAGIGGVYYYETRIAEKIKGHQLGALANSIITHVDATHMVPPLIPFKKKKLSLAEFSHLLSQYLMRVKSTNVNKADRTTFVITHPQSRLVPGQDFKDLVVVRDAYMLVAEMIQNRVKASQVVPPTFLVQGFKFGISDVAYILSMAVAGVRNDGRLPRAVRISAATKISAGAVEEKEAGGSEEAIKSAETSATSEMTEEPKEEGDSQIEEPILAETPKQTADDTVKPEAEPESEEESGIEG